MARGRKKGQPKQGGRKRGTPNKTTASVKAALVEAFGELGGVASLVKWGKENPGEFYRLWGRMLPTEIANADGAFKVQNVVEVVVKSREEADKVLALNKAGKGNG